MSQLCLILPDQLSLDLSSIRILNPKTDSILMCEISAYFTEVKHHQKKIVLMISAMRHFRDLLVENGYHVDYVTYNHPENTHQWLTEVKRYLTKKSSKQLVVTHSNHYALHHEMLQWHDTLKCPVNIIEDDRFLCTIDAFEQWSQGRKQLRMEYFYRHMRVTHQILMSGHEPEGGQWNYDADNRKKPPKNVIIPSPKTFTPDHHTQDAIHLVKEYFADHFGSLEPFSYAVTRAQAKKVLDQFIQQRLHLFGDYQDAMLMNEPWMYHAHISFYLNIGLLKPKECIDAAVVAYNNNAPINAVEGFIRQILGWREFIRGIYWLKMPDYEHTNVLNATQSLPNFFWDANTELNCLKQCISETRENAYAHHIQRLMVLGNFALLTGLSPKEVNEWYYIVYADAHHWVELPNVTGMILFADGGVFASKPYAAGGRYIDKMSNYCQSCQFNPKEKTGEKACPFNYLYWNFLIKNRELFAKNPRIAMMYRTYDRMDDDIKKQISHQSKTFIQSLDT
ncbi:MAG: cryptochrome/photolyase family protein [Candidatus Comchoanobacterales bacterium]